MLENSLREGGWLGQNAELETCFQKKYPAEEDLKRVVADKTVNLVT